MTKYRLLESGKVVPVVYERTYALEELPAGLDALEKRQTYGKVVVRIREDDEQHTRARL